MADDRTTIEVSESIRNRLREYKDKRGQTYDGAIDGLLSMAGAPGGLSIRSAFQYTNPEFVYRCRAESLDLSCIYTPPFRASDPYLYKSTSTAVFSEFIDEFEPLLRYFNLYREKREQAGIFGVSQSGYNWFGRGFDNFLKLCTNQDERYAELDNINPHHSETAVYVYRKKGTILLIYGQPSRRHDQIGHAGLYLLTSGCPTRNDFITLLDQLPETMSNGHSWDPYVLDWWNGRAGYGPREVPPTLAELDPQTGISITDDQDDILGYVCHNPYYGRPPEQVVEEITQTDEYDQESSTYKIS